jgi:hypothetical protein
MPIPITKMRRTGGTAARILEFQPKTQSTVARNRPPGPFLPSGRNPHRARALAARIGSNSALCFKLYKPKSDRTCVKLYNPKSDRISARCAHTTTSTHPNLLQAASKDVERRHKNAFASARTGAG